MWKGRSRLLVWFPDACDKEEVRLLMWFQTPDACGKETWQEREGVDPFLMGKKNECFHFVGQSKKWWIILIDPPEYDGSPGLISTIPAGGGRYILGALEWYRTLNVGRVPLIWEGGGSLMKWGGDDKHPKSGQFGLVCCLLQRPLTSSLIVNFFISLQHSLQIGFVMV